MFSVGSEENDENSEKNCVPTSIFGAFRYVINKERNIISTRDIKIQAGLTFQIEKHSKVPIKNYSKNNNIEDDFVTYEVRRSIKTTSLSLHIPNKRRGNAKIFRLS
jgi:hypothetical protein